MRSIFWKIFLSFWLVQALFIGMALVLAERPSKPVVAGWRTMTSGALAYYGQNAVAMLRQGGTAQLGDYFHQVEQRGGIRFYLFDAQGREVSGQAAPEAARKLAAAVRGRQVAEISRIPHATFAARPVAGEAGGNYTIVAEVHHGPLVPWWPLGRDVIVRLSLSILISGLVCFWLARYLVGPITQLRAATREIARGQLSARAGRDLGRRKDEIGVLVDDFNHMAERIENLVKSQEELLSDISHELRSPLARLNVALGLVRQRTGSEAAEFLDRIETEAERLNDLIGKLLQLARLESGDGAPPKAQVALGELVEAVAEDADFEARSRNCSVRLVVAEDSTVLGYAELLRSAVENVVRNAVRYTSEGTAVEIGLGYEAGEDGAGQAVVRVRDHGPGVPEEAIEKLFRPFYRLDNSRERKTGGVGLGLAIADRIARMHGGVVTATNAPDGGLVLEIRLPVTVAGAT
jgi:two-component system, OmpR family, sensor histidine kinase CpxA